jgi:hypothetical protein
MGSVVPASFYATMADAVLFLHVVFIVWVIFGAVLAVRRPVVRALHLACLVWAVLTEVLPWPCPLTLLENWLEQRAGVQPYQGGFVMHYLDKLLYPDLPQSVLTIAAVVVCGVNLGFYARLSWKNKKMGQQSVRRSA